MIELEERKKIMLGILLEFQKYCSQNNLSFYLGGGTLLGAIRHHGFIPWDDDIDVIMPIDDYNRLIKIEHKNPIKKPYRILTPENYKDHCWPMLKVIDTRTSFIEPMLIKRLRTSQKDNYGIYIDIFPMYGLPSSKEERVQFQNQLCDIYEKFKKATRIMNRRPKDGKTLFLLRSITYELYTLPQKLIGGNYYLHKISQKIMTYPYKTCEFFGYTAGLTPNCRDHMRSAVREKEMEATFEGHQFKILAAYDEMLSIQYGEDYMELPPVEKRRTHPSIAEWR